VADRKFLDSLDYTIVNYDSTKFETGKGLFPDDYSATDVTPNEIVQCEKILKAFLIRYNSSGLNEFDSIRRVYPKYDFRRDDFLIEPKEYGRQYIAAISPKGIKVIYVNCFCDSEGFENKSKELVWVNDGGECYFHFKVNIATGELKEFQKNGVG
jgi:hypothetical protein